MSKYSRKRHSEAANDVAGSSRRRVSTRSRKTKATIVINGQVCKLQVSPPGKSKHSKVVSAISAEWIKRQKDITVEVLPKPNKFIGMSRRVERLDPEVIPGYKVRG